jgi:hypothetical protein
LRSAWAKYFRDPVWKRKPSQKRDVGVDQGVGPEVKTQKSKKMKKENLL